MQAQRCKCGRFLDPPIGCEKCRPLSTKYKRFTAQRAREKRVDANIARLFMPSAFDRIVRARQMEMEVTQ